MENKQYSNLPSSLVVLGLTALAYMVSFVFQYGFLNTFGISYKVIDVSIPSLIIGIGFTLLVAFNVDQILGVYRTILNNSRTDTPLSRLSMSYVRTIPIIVLMLLALYGLNMTQFVLGSLISFAFMMVMINLGPITIKAIRNKSFTKGVGAHYEYRDKMDSKRTQHEHQGYSETYINYVIWIITFLILALVGGRLYASSQNGFYVIHSSDEVKTIMIQKSGDTIITKDYDVDSKQLLSGFSVRKIDQAVTFNERIEFNIDDY